MCANSLLSIHFDTDKTKCILFSEWKILPGLNITYDNNKIKEFDLVKQFGCYLDAKLSGKSMEMKSLKKVSAKL